MLVPQLAQLRAPTAARTLRPPPPPPVVVVVVVVAAAAADDEAPPAVPPLPAAPEALASLSFAGFGDEWSIWAWLGEPGAGAGDTCPSISRRPDAAKALLYVGHPEQADDPPVPSHRPSPGQVPLLVAVAGAETEGLFEEALLDVASLLLMTEGAANGERLVVVVVVVVAVELP